MHRLMLLLAFLLAPFGLVLMAIAQTPVPAAPGSGHGFLIDKHLAAGVDCAACHRTAPPPQAAETTDCLACHGSYQQLAAKTADKDGTHNPHASHLGDLPCEACHHVHKASEVFCDQCHAFGMTAP